MKDPIENLSIEDPTPDIYKWNFILTGPKDTPWEDELYDGTITFPHNYPFSPPQIQFTTKLFLFINSIISSNKLTSL